MVFVRYPDARLGRKAEPRAVDAALREIGDRLLRAVEEARAYGLAAVHIGEVAPVVVVSLASDPAKRDYRLLYNPVVADVAEEVAGGPEGSVSMPGIEVEIVRPNWAEIAFEGAEGKAETLRLEGWPARVAQHEIDQMNGIFFLDRVSRLKREMSIKRFRKLSAG